MNVSAWVASAPAQAAKLVGVVQPPALDLGFQASRALGITSCPTLILDRDGARTAVELSYGPATAAARVGAMLLKDPMTHRR